MSNHSNSVPASYGGALLTQPICIGAYDEQRKAYEMSRHLQELTSENTRLRNSIINANDEVFSLRACMASVELEAKYNAEQELLHMQSELTFKNKELSSLNKDYQKLLKELSALKQTSVGAASTKESGQLPADFSEHSRAADADADAALDRIVASEPMTPPLDINYVGATIKGHTDHDNCNSLPEAPAASRDDAGDDEVCDTSEGSLPPLSAAHIAGSSSSHSSAPERQSLPPPSPTSSLASASRVNYISFLFQTYSTAVQQNSSPRIRSPSDLQRESTRCKLLREVAKEVKALSDQALDPRTCNSIDWSSLGRKALHLCRYVSLMDPRRVEPIGLQLLDAVFCAGPLQEGLASRAGKLAVGVANPSHSRVVAALQMPLLRDPIDVSPACQLSSKEPADSSCDKDYLLYLEDVLHRLCAREERRPMVGGGAMSEADLVQNRRAMELTVSSIVNFFSVRIFSYGSEGIDGSSCEEKQLLEMLFDSNSRAAHGRLEACPVSSRGAVLFAAFSQEHSLLSAGVKTRLLRLCGCALTNQRLFRLFASNQRYSKQASVPVKEEDVADQRSSSAVDTASLLSRRCQSPSFLIDVVHSLTSKDNDFCCCSSASVEQLHFKVQMVEFLLRLLFSRGSEFVQLMLGTQLTSVPDDNKVDRVDNKVDRVDNKVDRVDNKVDRVESGSSLRKRRADAHLQREAKTQSPRATLESTIPLASEQTLSSSSGSRAVARQVGTISCPFRVEIDHSSTDCRLVCMLADYWMHLIRSLDVCSELLRGATTQTVLVQLVSRLHSLLAGLLDYLSAADCDFILSDLHLSDLFHEYIYRWNTFSWHGDLRRMMTDSMFKFLEVNRPLQE